jgi:predicted permease
MRMFERVGHDLRYAARALRRSPTFALTVVVVLAIGIGANTAIFSVAKETLFRPLPYPEPDRLVQLVSRTRTGTAALVSLPKFTAWRGLRLHESIAAFFGGGPGVTLLLGDRREHVPAMYVSSGYFQVFKAPLTAGRTFRLAEDVPQGPRVAVISHALATRLFGRAEVPLGRLLPLGDGAYEIVGVLGAGFRPQPHADVFLPLQTPQVSFDHTNYLTVVARLKPSVSIDRADREVRDTTMAFQELFPWALGPYEAFGAAPLEHMLAGDSRQALQVLSAAVVFVLLIACANAANLFATRSARRRADITTRAALGAGRGRLARQLFAECLLLAIAGGGLGLALGYAGIRGLLAAIPGAMAGSASASADARVATFTLALSILTAIAFGLLPVLRASKVDLSTALKDTAADIAGGRQSRQSLLVVAEITMAIVLLVGAGLLARTFLSLRSVERGFRTTDLLALDTPLTGPEYQAPAAVDGLVRDVARRLDAVAGARGVAATYALPIERTVSLPFTLLDRPLDTAPYHGVGSLRMVSPEYFTVAGVNLLRGRGPTEHDTEATQRVVIISRVMARRFWQDRDPIGRKVLIGGPGDRALDPEPRIIVGLAADVRESAVSRDPEPAMYIPIAQAGDRLTARTNKQYALTWLVHSDGDGPSFRREIEDALRAATSGQPVARVRRIEDVVRAATAQLEFTAVLLTVFAAAALVLATVGLYGVMAYSVEQRRQEIGIRLALGADPAVLRTMVLLQGGRLAAAGVGSGLGLAFALARALASRIEGLAAWDTGVFGLVAALLALVSLAATYLPAQEATRIDPLRTLRRA